MRRRGDEGDVDPRDDVDRLLDGAPGSGSPALVELISVLRASAQSPPPRPADVLAELLRNGTPSPPPSRRWQRTAARGSARTAAARLTVAGLAAQLLLGGGVAVAAVGTSAGAGVLPEEVQRTVSGLVHRVVDVVMPGASQHRPSQRGRTTTPPGAEAADGAVSRDGPRPQVPPRPHAPAPAAPTDRRDAGRPAATAPVRPAPPQADKPSVSSADPVPARPAVRRSTTPGRAVSQPAEPGPATRQAGGTGVRPAADH